MTKRLRVAEDFTLPADVALHKNAIVAMSGAGKSNTGVALAEEMYAAEIPWVTIDPKGDWFGVRSSGDGRGPGLAVPVFGGLHGDIPLEPSSGKLIAKLITDQRLTCVLDVSEFDTRQAMWRFLADLGEGLLKLNRDPVHLFLDEADDYIPQRTGEKGELPRCKGVWSRVVRRGRFRGIGTCLITQRSAVIDKDVLTQTDNLFAMRVTSPQDRKPIADWVEAKGLDSGMIASLAGLEDGECWIWSPQKLKMLERVQLRRRWTFDAGETPKLGKERRPPAKLADIDLGAIETEMRETIERAKADDPAELRRRIAVLERDLAAAAERDAHPLVERVEIIPAEFVKRLELALQGLDELAGAFDERSGSLGKWLDDALSFAKTFTSDAGSAATARSAAPVREERRPPAPRSSLQTHEHPQAPGVAQLSGPQQRVLDALAWWGVAGRRVVSRLQLAAVAGYHKRTKSFTNALGSLNTAGLVVYPSAGYVSFGPGGVDAANHPASPPTVAVLQDMVREQVGAGRTRILDVLIRRYPDAVPRETLALELGVHERTKSFTNALGSLRSLGWIDYPSAGYVAASDALFLEARS